MNIKSRAKGAFKSGLNGFCLVFFFTLAVGNFHFFFGEVQGKSMNVYLHLMTLTIGRGIVYGIIGFVPLALAFFIFGPIVKTDAKE